MWPIKKGRRLSTTKHDPSINNKVTKKSNTRTHSRKSYKWPQQHLCFAAAEFGTNLKQGQATWSGEARVSGTCIYLITRSCVNAVQVCPLRMDCPGPVMQCRTTMNSRTKTRPASVLTILHPHTQRDNKITSLDDPLTKKIKFNTIMQKCDVRTSWGRGQTSSGRSFFIVILEDLKTEAAQMP